MRTPPLAAVASAAALLASVVGGAASGAGPAGREAQPDPRFVDHGIAAQVAECRGIVAAHTQDGRDLVLANTSDMSTRGYVLITDIRSGHTEQLYCPEGVANSPPYAAILASSGRFYTAQGPVLLELDPATASWQFHGVPSPDAAAYLAFTEGPDGRIWAASVYGTVLVSFDPATRQMTDHGRLDPEEQYVFDLAVDDTGWVYAGVGTARGDIVAYNPVTDERRGVVPEAERTHESGVVYPTVDGAAVGRAAGRTYHLIGGVAREIDPGQAPARRDVGDIYWSQGTARFPDGTRVVAYDLPDRWLEVVDAGATERRRIEFDYASGGVSITSLGEGPAAMVYGSTAHPMHLLAFDAARRSLADYGPIRAIGGGNLCAITHQGEMVIGAQYSHGRLWAYNAAEPWAPEDGNPRWLAEWPRDICRPRTALAHPDGHHVMMAGFADYGLCGGGIGIVDLDTGQSSLLTADEDLLPGHSPIALVSLPDGDLVGGTSVDCPGGGHSTATEAELFLLDWESREVVHHVVPVPGDRNLVSLVVARDGRVHGLSSRAIWFVFDPRSREIVHSQSLSPYGSVPRHALHVARDGSLRALMSSAILRLDPSAFTHEVLARTPAPITAGGARVGDTLVYAGGPRVWSFTEPRPGVLLPVAMGRSQRP